MEQTYFSEVQPERDISGDNFSKGEINYQFQMDSRGYWNPYRSYFKLRFKLTKGNDAAIDVAKFVPSHILFDNLFQQQRICLDNVCLSEVNDYVPQVSSLKHRMYKSEAYLKSFGNVSNFTDSDKTKRGSQYGTNKEYEVIAKPCIGFFDIDGFIPSGGSSYCITLTPQSGNNFKKMAIQSIGTEVLPGTDADTFKFEIISMNLYIFKALGPPVKQKQFKFNIKEINCQTQNLTTSSLSQKSFSVHPRTSELTLAYQKTGAGYSNSLYPATFFTSVGNDEQKLTRFYITYGGKQLPTPIPDLSYSTAKNFMLHRYYETLIYTGGINSKLEYEDFNTWLLRGPYYHFSGYGNQPKFDRVMVAQQFTGLTDTDKPNVLLFNHYLKSVVLNIVSGKLQNVSSN